MNKLIATGILVLAIAGASEVTQHPTSRTTSVDAAARGQGLFHTKGCITCHVHGRAGGERNWENTIGPNLTNYSNDPAFLRRWLEQPGAVRANTMMPDLDLSASEIDDLIAFLNQSRD